MNTKKQGQCKGDCCYGDQEIEPLYRNQIYWKSSPEKPKCDCIKLKTECGPSCGCDPKKCSNRQMSMKQSLQMSIDIEEKVTWGMDTCTQVNFLTICPRDMPLQMQSQFVEKKLIYAIQQQNENGFDILKALDFIITVDLNDEVL